MTHAIFAELSEADRTALFAKAQKHSMPAGEIVIREGEDGAKLFLIDAGVVAITRQEGDAIELLNVLAQGEYFGEMALLTIAPRSATARTIEPCEFTVINHDDFQQFIAAHPQAGMLIYRNFAKRLSERVRRLSERFQRVHARVAGEMPSAATTSRLGAPSSQHDRLFTPAILIKGIIELLRDRELPVAKRKYFESVLCTQLQVLSEHLGKA